MRIGMIGLGLMGHSMAANLAKAGFSVTANDARPESAADLKGVQFASSASEVGQASDIVLLSLPGPQDVEAVCVGPKGLAKTLKRGACQSALNWDPRSASKGDPSYCLI